MSMARRLIALMRSGVKVNVCYHDAHNRYYTIESSDTHIAIWPHWTMIRSPYGDETRRFYVCINPAYKYASSYKACLDQIENDTASRHG